MRTRRGTRLALLVVTAVAGTTLVTLDVDGGNDSGALTVYERAGMTVRTRNLVLQRPLGA